MTAPAIAIGIAFVSMREAVSKSLFTYWNTLRGSRPAPKRFEIDPSRIATNLPETFILERINEASARFRLAGTRITEAFGMELRGRNLFELFNADDASTLQDQMELITSHCAVGVFHISAESEGGLSTTFEVLILPLTHTRDSVDRFLGCIISVDKPSWLGAVALTRRTLLDHEILWPDGSTSKAAAQSYDQRRLIPHRREARIVRSAQRQFRVYEGGLSHAGDER